MAYIAQPTAGSSFSLRRMVADLRQSFARDRAFKRTYKELSALTDRELEDIGLCRGDVFDASRIAARNV